jgi:hypothetical protein
MVIEKAGIDAEVARLTRLRGQHQSSQYNLRSRLRHQTDELPRLESRLAAIRKDMAARHDTSGDNFAIEIEGEVVRDRGLAGELILRRAEKLKGTTLERTIGRFAGFPLVVADFLIGGPQVHLRGAARTPPRSRIPRSAPSAPSSTPFRTWVKSPRP